MLLHSEHSNSTYYKSNWILLTCWKFTRKKDTNVHCAQDESFQDEFYVILAINISFSAELKARAHLVLINNAIIRRGASGALRYSDFNSIGMWQSATLHGSSLSVEFIFLAMCIVLMYLAISSIILPLCFRSCVKIASNKFLLVADSFDLLHPHVHRNTNKWHTRQMILLLENLEKDYTLYEIIRLSFNYY